MHAAKYNFDKFESKLEYVHVQYIHAPLSQAEFGGPQLRALLFHLGIGGEGKRGWSDQDGHFQLAKQDWNRIAVPCT